MRKLGQHFLKNSAVIKEIITALDLQTGEHIIEIGAGHGELTLPLAEACAQKNCSVIAIEKDVRLITDLQFKINDLEIKKNITVIDGDIRTALPPLTENLKSNVHYKIAGNIPYYLTGHLLRSIGELSHQPARCVFLLQKEVAERIIAAPPKMNRLSAHIQSWAEPRIITTVPARDFSPPPDVDSAVITLTSSAFLPRSLRAQYEKAVQALFAQPRKTILNNLAAKMGKEKSSAAEKLARLGFSASLRPQNLSVRDIQKIAEVFF